MSELLRMYRNICYMVFMCHVVAQVVALLTTGLSCRTASILQQLRVVARRVGCYTRVIYIGDIQSFRCKGEKNGFGI